MRLAHLSMARVDSHGQFSPPSFLLSDVAGAAALVLQSNSTVKAAEVAGILINKAASDAVADVKTRSPNKLLYVGDIVSTSTPPPPPTTTGTGKVTFKVVYDAYRTETQWGLSQLVSGTWSQLPNANFLAPKTKKQRIVNWQFADGYYSFDINDSKGDGLEAPGSFTITAFDTKEVLHQGGPGTFERSYSVEFQVVKGVVSTVWSGEFHL
jgi:hypothetical protein